MNRLFLSILCLLGITFSYGQQSQPPASNDAAGNYNYLEYYHAVAGAEEAIVQGRYREATGLYQSVFSKFPYNNPVDCYVAGQVAGYLGDTVGCQYFLQKGLSFGLPVQTILSNPHLETVFRCIAPQIIDSCRHLYQGRINQEARARVLSLSRRDQLIAALPTSLYEPGDKMLKKEYRPVYDSMMDEIVALTRSIGFPAQKTIGTQTYEDSVLTVGPHSTFVYFILIHYCNAWSRIGELLWPELLKGNITPQMYGAIYERSNEDIVERSRMQYFALRACEQKECRKMIRGKGLKAINDARWAIGLGSYGVMQQKYLSRNRYYEWRRQGAKNKEPFFDFQCDLHFQKR